jgi:hypothetical protein
MVGTKSLSETASTVTGTLLDLIRQGKVASDRLLRENAYLRAEVARLTRENSELRLRLDQGPEVRRHDVP